MTKTTISSKNQITLPKSVTKTLHLKPGSKLRIISRGNQIILEPQPESLTKYYKGVGKGAWKKSGGVEAFIKKERESWGNR